MATEAVAGESLIDTLLQRFVASNLTRWTGEFGFGTASDVGADASVRGFWRLHGTDGRTAILLHRGSWDGACEEIDIGSWLLARGVRVPRTIASDPAAGLILQEDL